MPRKTEKTITMNKETPEQEAERLYPLIPELGEFDVAKVQRSAHITAARMYMGEAETFKTESEKYRNALKAILQRCATSGEDYGQAIYEISEMAYGAIRIDFPELKTNIAL